MARKKKVLEPDYIEKLTQRIDECDTVVRELENSKVWQIVQKDMQEERTMLDDNWQEIVDEKKLASARVLKFAVVHILNLKEKYSEELKSLQEELSKHENKDSVILKDYDNSPLEEK